MAFDEGLERQLQQAQHKDELHRMIDTFDDATAAVLVVHHDRHGAHGGKLGVMVFGRPLATELLGLLGYADVIVKRGMWADGDD